MLRVVWKMSCIYQYLANAIENLFITCIGHLFPKCHINRMIKHVEFLNNLFCVCMCACMSIHDTSCIQKSEDNLQKSFFFTMWSLWMELRSSGLVSGTFAQPIISLAIIIFGIFKCLALLLNMVLGFIHVFCDLITYSSFSQNTVPFYRYIPFLFIHSSI